MRTSTSSRPTSAFAATRPSSAVYHAPTRPTTARLQSQQQTTTDRNTASSAAASSSSPRAASRSSTFPSFTAALENRELQSLFDAYLNRGSQHEDEEEKTQHNNDATQTKETRIAGKKERVVVLRPKSARTTVHRPVPPGAASASATASMSSGSHPVAARPAASSFSSAQQQRSRSSVSNPNREYSRPIDLNDSDESDDGEEYPDMDAIMIPRRSPMTSAFEAARESAVTNSKLIASTANSSSSSKQPTRRPLSYTDKTLSSTSWHDAAVTRSIPLIHDDPLSGHHTTLQEIEQLRRRYNTKTSKQRESLEKRDKPWRYNTDNRWIQKEHKKEVEKMHRNLDALLTTWNNKGMSNHELKQEEEQKENDQTTSPDPSITSSPPNVPPGDSLLYTLITSLESQLAQLEIYDQIFKGIVRPDVPTPNVDGDVTKKKANDLSTTEPLSSTLCPSRPLCDLLDRIRVANRCLRTPLNSLLVEVRRRMELDWTTKEMQRRKEVIVQSAKEDITEWTQDLQQEQMKSEQRDDELSRLKTSLITHSSYHTFFDAPVKKADALYDTMKRKLIVLKTQKEIDEAAEQPVQWYGEKDAGDEEDEREDEDGSSSTSKAYQNHLAQRKLHKIQERLKYRAQLRVEELKDVREKLAAVKSKERAALSKGLVLSAKEQADLKHLVEEEERLKNAMQNGGGKEDKVEIDVSSSEESDADDGTKEDPSSTAASTSDKLSHLTPAALQHRLLSRVSRSVARAFTTRPLLHITTLQSGDRIGSKLFWNSNYFMFDFDYGKDDAVNIRLFTNEPGSSESYIEVQLAYARPPTRYYRYFVSTTQDATAECVMRLEGKEMKQEMMMREEKLRKRMGTNASTSTAQSTSGRWYLRVSGRGYSLKKYTIEFRVQSRLMLDYTTKLNETINDLETQLQWQENLKHKTKVLDELAKSILPTANEEAIRQRSSKAQQQQQQHRTPFSQSSSRTSASTYTNEVHALADALGRTR